MTDPHDTAAARRSALAVLAYADNTEASLIKKLKSKGFADETIAVTVSDMKSYGYLNEERFVKRAAEILANEKYYGRRRIYAELHKKGFRTDVIDSLDMLDIDFVSNCAHCITVRGELGDKDVAALLRRGYSINEIKLAAEKLRKSRK